MIIVVALGIFALVAYAGYVQAFEQDRETRKEIHDNEHSIDR